ncbi:winged helix-turn-helix transcriptional regulator [Alteromonas facilis]|uniref:winged helix-turn-helix transcriptional regulator n=1 Tax=Alteromonas facilis TaxID=2048004 RepID=UPI000C288962|nr:winged helix-turn-helix transcriptional regulator [Alteromonas facilis]
MTAEHHQSSIKTGSLTLDFNQRTVTSEGEALPIRGLTFEMLAALVEARNDVVSVEALAKRVWKEKVVSDDTIAQRISLLRKALPVDCSNYIESVRSEGYRWVPPVESANQAIPRTSQQNNYRQWLITATLSIGFALIALWLFSPSPAVQPSVAATKPVEHGLDASVYTRVKLARAQQYANASTQYTNSIAITLYQDLFQDDPNNPLVNFGLAKVILDGVLKFNADKSLLTPVNKLIEGLLLQAPTDANYLWLRGYYFEVNGNVTKAISNYETAHQQDPNNAQISLSLAHLYIIKGRLHDALVLSLESKSDQHRAQFLHISQILYLTGQHARAREWFDATLQLSPDDPSVNLAYCRLLMSNNDYQQALHIIETFHQRHEGSVTSHILAYTLFTLLDRPEDAQSALNTASALEPSSFHVTAYTAWHKFNENGGRFIAKNAPNFSDDSMPDVFVSKAVSSMAADDKESALASLSRALRLGFIDFEFIKQIPAFLALHDNGIFKEIMLSMKGEQDSQRQAISSLEIPTL